MTEQWKLDYIQSQHTRRCITHVWQGTVWHSTLREAKQWVRGVVQVKWPGCTALVNGEVVK